MIITAEQMEQLRFVLPNIDELVAEDDVDELLEQLGDKITEMLDDDMEDTPESLPFQELYTQIDEQNM